MGRTIDADALRARMYHESFETDSDMQRWDSGCWIRYKLFEKCLEEQPTVQPRRLRGRWVETERQGVLAGAKYYKCDICAQVIVVVDSTPMADGYNYCPRCGSQMEEGQDES